MKNIAITGGKPLYLLQVALALLLGATAVFTFAAPARAFGIAFPTVPASATAGTSFSFSVNMSVAAAEYVPIQGVNLYLYLTGDRASYQASCINLPLAAGSKLYSDAQTGGGTVSVIATTTERWEYRPGYGYGYGLGVTSIQYDVVWYVPARWRAGQAQAEVRVTASNNNLSQTSTPFTLNIGAPLGATNLSTYSNAAGVLVQNVTAASPDGRARVVIAKGTKGSAVREPLSQVSVLPMGTAPPAPVSTSLVDRPYTFGPEGAAFDPSVTVIMVYDAAQLPAGVDEKTLVIAVWNQTAGVWDSLASAVDTPSHTVSAQVGHFSIFAILASVRSAAFTIGDLSVTPSVESGKQVTASVTINNTGDLSGTYNVSLKVDDMPAVSSDVTVAGRSSQTVALKTQAVAVGTHAIDVNGLGATFTVTPPLPPPPKPTPAPRPTYTPTYRPSATPTPVPAAKPGATASPTPVTPKPSEKAPEPSSGIGWLPIVAVVALGGVFGIAIWKVFTHS